MQAVPPVCTTPPRPPTPISAFLICLLQVKKVLAYGSYGLTCEQHFKLQQPGCMRQQTFHRIHTDSVGTSTSL